MIEPWVVSAAISERLCCPCCAQTCELAAQPQLAAADAVLRRRRGGAAGRVIALARDPAWKHWACVACLDAGLALAADVNRQAGLYWGPYVAYLPVPLICRECRESFVFTPERQREWYEVRGRYLGKSPLRCQTCGPRHGLQVRVGKALQAALRELDGRDVEALLRVAELHGELGHAAKAEEFVRRACNQAERRDCLPAIAARVSALRERLSAAAAER